MNITELDSYNLADAVKFNEKLNPRIWQGEKMKPQVREKLLQIAEDFKQSLGLSDLEVKDITVSGSNAGYTYTPNSDIDLHLVVDLPQADTSEVYRELFDAKKFQYNETHNITIGGYDVELYVENANEPPVSQGMYSVVKDDWINIPKKRRSTVNDNAVKSKYDVMKHRIESAIASKNFKRLTNTAAKIKKMRQAGLDKHGELGPENLAYKMLRTQGTIKALYDARTAAQDKKLSLKERPAPEYKKVFYGFTEDVGITPDGVSPETKMFLSEVGHENEQLVNDFIHDTANWLGINEMPVIELHSDPEWGEANHSFGRYDPDSHTLHVNLANRHVMDILRTTAHELAHCKQHENSPLPVDAGDTGSPWENEAHAVAGIVMRHYADRHPELFADSPEITESASGYIPKNKKEAQDPRWEMALSVDIKPGQVGKEANKLALQTDKQGKPALLMKTANTLAESLAQELSLFESGQDLFEIKMTGKNLAKLASDIKGARVGLEFEMIVPDATVEDDGDMEPDYDRDERVRDIDDAVEFFDDGDYNGRADLRRLREAMQESYWQWKSEALDHEWYNGNGFDYFTEWLEGNDPFDEEDAEQEARNELQAQYGDELSGEDFDQMLYALIEEKRQAYVQEQWDDQSGNFDDAKQEYDDEHSDDYSEEDWLREQGIRYASDVESNFGYVTWPYYTSNSSDGEADIERIALEFMNDSGLPYNSVAVSSSYHGTYKKWVGNGWVSVGSNKPDDCFSIEPDGSLDGNSSSDVGLEFVSPPIPLDQVQSVMQKVQQWAADNGVYTGKANKTSMHTNISVPGYDLDKLDYLKAALLLGDEYVLREFDRIGNSYAKPAIEKVRQLVNQKPEKAKELLDKMKSQLNAAASKLIHSGTTDKFTSINTKGNRIEFRSPGGDYLSDIADNPKKMQDMINRMVVVMDAALDPNKYKEEYQKKLYKMLTGQQFGREAKTGAKQETKKGTDDLLNIFSRYAAGELPKAALKSFVRQAQLERKLKKGDTGGKKYWWNVQWDNNRRIEVVAGSKEVAKQVAAEEWRVPESQLAGAVVTPLRPYTEPPAGSELERIERQAGVGQQGVPGLYKIFTTGGQLIAGDTYDNDRAALERAAYWAQQRGVEVVVKNDRGQEIGRVSSSGTITPAGNPDEEPLRGGNNTGPYELYNRETGEAIYHIDPDAAVNDQEALAYLRNYRDSSSRPNEIGVRRRPVPGSTLDLQRQRAQQSSSASLNGRASNPDGNYVIVDSNNDDTPVFRFVASGFSDAMTVLRQWENAYPGTEWANRFDPDQRLGQPAQQSTPIPGSTLDLQRQRAAQAQQDQGNWGIWINANDRFANQPGTYARGETPPLIRFPSREAAEQWIEQQRAERPNMRTDIEVREIEPARQPVGDINLFPEIEPAQQDNWSQDFERRMQAGTTDAAQGGIVDVAGNQVGQTYTPTGSGSFTGQWLILNPNNQVIYRFGGIGNSQSDANRIAMAWLQQNPRQMQDGVTVVPEMG